MNLRDPAARWRIARWLAVANFVGLVVFRIVFDQDEFANWDLISLLHATAAHDFWRLLQLPAVHLTNPFTFPIYNTGSESVVSLLIHRVVAGVTPYWSNAVVVLVYDLVFVSATIRLQQLVFRREASRCAAWCLMAMSPVILTFSSISAFNMQGFATIVVALLGCELVLHARYAFGISLLAVAFLSISQAYGLAFYIPVFAGAWLIARAVMLWTAGSRGRRSIAVAAAALIAMTVAVQIASGGEYLIRIAATSTATDADTGLLQLVAGNAYRLVRASAGFGAEEALAPAGFAPWFLLVEAAMLGLFGLAGLRSRGPDGREAAPIAFPWKRVVPIACWLLLIAVGYVPALVGGTIKSQRCFFGDYFLVMALAPLAGQAAAASPLRRLFQLQLAAVLLLSNLYYVSAVASVDHSENHMPIFDYDLSDSRARHDLTRMIVKMRSQATDEKALVVVDYPKGHEENRTDPALFHGRFLRHFGSFRSSRDVHFTCKYCDGRYGCPFLEVHGRPCASTCCRQDAQPRISAALAQNRAVYLWTLRRDRDERRSRILGALEQRLTIGPCGVIPPASWTCWKLTPAAKSP